jgi:hypothetical protein
MTANVGKPSEPWRDPHGVTKEEDGSDSLKEASGSSNGHSNGTLDRTAGTGHVTRLPHWLTEYVEIGASRSVILFTLFFDLLLVCGAAWANQRAQHWIAANAPEGVEELDVKVMKWLCSISIIVVTGAFLLKDAVRSVRRIWDRSE